MVRLDLTDEERSVLIEALESFLSDLRFEIADTERQAFRQPLKDQETVIKRVLETLRQGKEIPQAS